MKTKSWINYIAAYILWFTLLGLGIWLGLIGQNAFEAFLGSQTAQNHAFTFVKQMVFLDRAFIVSIWLVWLVMMIVSEESFRRGARSGGLLKRFARFAGPLLILLFLADGYLLWVRGLSSTTWLRWLILAVELAGGILLILFGRPFRRSSLARPKIY